MGKSTSQFASESGLPCSRVNNRANSSCLASNASANLPSSAPRSRIGLAEHTGNAALAAATPASSGTRSARGASASTSSVAGLMTSSLAAPDTSLPLISSLNSLIALSLLRYILCELTIGASAVTSSREAHQLYGGDTKLEATRSDLGIAN